MTPRFGVTISLQAGPGKDPAAEARHAEQLGFDFVSMWDHLPGEQASYETWTALSWMAARTEKLGLVTNVLGLPYRSPAVLAKMAESLHRLSGGRLVLGLGAGGTDEEFRSLGLPVRTRREKIDALEEALEVIHGLWTRPEPFSFEGRHYQLRDALISPKPETPIPIWLGTYGPRGLRLLGRRADGWIPSLPYAPPDTVPSRIETIRRAAKDAGRDPDDLTLAYNVGVKIGEGASSSRGIAGSPEEVAAAVGGFLEMGFSTINFFLGGDRAAQRERLAGEILPLLN
ncbi:MAG: LLM class flavin-dependent oxidoreductase [Actinomycetota bacterium]